MPGSLPFFAVWFEAKSGQSLQVVCFDPGMQILFLRHHKVADIGLLLLGYVFRWLVAGVPVQIPHLLKCDGKTTCFCLACSSHGTSKKTGGNIGGLTVRRHTAEPRQQIQQLLKFYKLIDQPGCRRRSTISTHQGAMSCIVIQIKHGMSSTEIFLAHNSMATSTGNSSSSWIGCSENPKLL